ncbi:MAG: hypothetical protein NTW21_14425 [Verrucomicrobia bacterium]|nr:hypothetical protein [Verrucomicrobiota bacterium]
MDFFVDGHGPGTRGWAGKTTQGPRPPTLTELEKVDPTYIAPEIKDDTTRSSPVSDVYSAGATIYEIVH